mmetsp:Transcript_121348/g.348681  ORF Transcript_121348/g.348681 Transcript_121348/m.348681 type:complete len:255 (-) Transcript_121348:267-1031(-)
MRTSRPAGRDSGDLELPRKPFAQPGGLGVSRLRGPGRLGVLWHGLPFRLLLRLAALPLLRLLLGLRRGIRLWLLLRLRLRLRPLLRCLNFGLLVFHLFLFVRPIPLLILLLRLPFAQRPILPACCSNQRALLAHIALLLNERKRLPARVVLLREEVLTGPSHALVAGPIPAGGMARLVASEGRLRLVQRGGGRGDRRGGVHGCRRRRRRHGRAGRRRRLAAAVVLLIMLAAPVLPAGRPERLPVFGLRVAVVEH